MNVLVTGGAGFIGSNLVEDILDSADSVVVLDNLMTGSLSNLDDLKGNIEFVEGSCLDIPKLDLSPDAIYHFGAPSSSPMYKGNPFLVGEAVNGMIAVLELAKKTGSRVIYASSSSLYSGINPPHDESMEIKVTDYYTEARLCMERIAELYEKLFGVSSLGMRFFSVYGPRENAKKEYANMVTQFLWAMREGISPVVFGDGAQTRDFVYVKDVTRALQLAMDSDYNGHLNVGTGNAYSFNQVIETLNKCMKLEIMPEYVDNPIKNYVVHTLAETSEAENVLGFKAQYDLDMGINELLKYYNMV